MAFAAVLVVLVAVTVGNLGSSKYEVHAIFQNASQLVRGNRVEVGGVSVGTVKSLTLTPDGQADATLAIEPGNYRPLRQGTFATVREASLSGVANRYVDLSLAPAGRAGIGNGGRIDQSSTQSAVDLDQIFNTFNKPNRKALSDVIKGLANLQVGQGKAVGQGLLYLNPALASSTALFREINYDTPMLGRFVVASSKLVTDIASRRNDLSGLINHLATATTAIGNQRVALASAISQLPPFFRQANTTFTNLRPTLDTLTTLVNDSKPVAVKLRPFFAQLRGAANEAIPTVIKLQNLIQNPTVPNSDLLSLTNSTPAVNQIANGPVTVDGASRPGAFPATSQALDTSTPEVAFSRPYAPDLTSWFNSFGHSGIADALGGASRVEIGVNVFANVSGALTLVPPELRQQALGAALTTGQRNRCPGAGEHPASDGSNPFHPAGYPCDPTQVFPGP